jgi:hypothetical protein
MEQFEQILLIMLSPFVYPNYEWTFNNPPTFKIYCHKYWQWRCDILPSKVNLRKVFHIKKNKVVLLHSLLLAQVPLVSCT